MGFDEPIFNLNFAEHYSYITEYRSECEIVFGGDCFDQFVSDFDDHSSKSVAI